MTYNTRHYINACSKITIVSSGYSVVSFRSWTQYYNTASCFAVRVKKEIIHANHITPPRPRRSPAETDLSSAIPGACEEANSSMGWVTIGGGGAWSG